MNNPQHRRKPILWILMAVCAVVLVGLMLIPVGRAQAPKRVTTHIDDKGTPYLGPISLGNKKIRSVALAAANGTADPGAPAPTFLP